MSGKDRNFKTVRVEILELIKMEHLPVLIPIIESRSFTVCYGGDVITQVLFLCPGLPDLAKELCMLYPEQAKIHFKIFTQYCYSEFKENSLSKFFDCT